MEKLLQSTLLYLAGNVDGSGRPAPQGHEDLSERWVGAGHPKAGDRLKLADGSLGTVLNVTTVQETREMFNLTVETAHTFYVGTQGWLAHNAGAPIHHVCTNKNFVKPGADGTPWSPKFEQLFIDAGYPGSGAKQMDIAINKVAVPGHKGPHPEAYHQIVYDRLLESVDGISPGIPEYRLAFDSALDAIKADILNPGSVLNRMITKR